MKDLILSIAFAVLTTVLIGCIFYYLPPSRGSLMAVIFISLSGYFTAIFSYLTYKEKQRPTRWHK